MPQQLYFKKLIVAGLIGSLVSQPARAVQQPSSSPAPAAPAAAPAETDFVAQTKHLAEGVAKDSFNLLLLSELQTALQIPSQLDEKALRAVMTNQSVMIENYKAQLSRLYSISSKDSSRLAGQMVSKIYADYQQVRAQLASGALTLETIRSDADAHRALVAKVVDIFLRNLDGTCERGLSVNPYDKIRPALQPLMPVYEIRLAMNLGGGASLPEFTPEHSGVSLAKTDEEKALWVGLYAGSVVASTFILGHGALTGAAFSNLALSTQLAALSMGLAITAAIAAVVVTTELIAARAESERLLAERRKIFLERADHTTVNDYFQADCRIAQQEFSTLRSEMEALARGDSTAGQKHESKRASMQALLKTYATAIASYNAKQAQILGADFNSAPKEEQEKRQLVLADTSESKAFLRLSRDLKAEQMSGLISFVLTDLYSTGVQYSREAETLYKNIAEKIDSDQVRKRGQILRKLSDLQNRREVEALTNGSFLDELKNVASSAELTAELDRIVIDFAQALFSADAVSQNVWELLEGRIEKLQAEAEHRLSLMPNDPILTHITKHLASLSRMSQEVGSL